jgi:hypothetical protein
VRSDTAPWLLFAAAALCAGAALRTLGLSEQIALDDELVSITASLARPYALLFGSFQPAYYSIPHALLLRSLADTVGLDEWTLRLPSLVAGLALLLGAPWLVWRRFGAAPAALFAALLAISPLLVLYSRIARAYAPATALVFFAVMALERWLAERKPAAALVYVGCAAAAIWFHQLAAPAVLAPLAVTAAFCVRDAPAGRRWRELGAPAWMALAIALIVTLLLWSALAVSLGPLATKVDRVSVPGLAILAAEALFAGTRELWLVGLFWTGATLGCVVGLWRHTRITSLLLASAAAQWLSVIAAGPWLAETPRILARYALFSLPFVLLFMALALAALGRLRVGGRAWPLPALAGALLCVLLFRQGPLPAALSPRASFAAHPDFMDPPLTPPDVPAWYASLRAEPGDFAIVEAPLRNAPSLVPYHVYQRVHGRPVRIGFLGALAEPRNPDEFALDDPRVGFRGFVDLGDAKALRASGARYLVLHRDLSDGLGVGRAAGAFAQQLGAPVYEDARLVVFVLR